MKGSKFCLPDTNELQRPFSKAFEIAMDELVDRLNGFSSKSSRPLAVARFQVNESALPLCVLY